MSDLPAKKQIPLDAVLVIGLWLLVCAIEFLTIIVLSDGKFTYTLDDPYIHLAVAEQIAGGKYGINAEEFSAPSSSPIWPFLLAPLARFSIGEYLPLVLNLAFGALTAWIILNRARKVLPSSLTGRVVAAWVILLGCNATGIVFTGMEHSLQLLAAVAVVDGMIRIADGDRLSRWFWVAVIAGPLVRYENLALSAAACGLLLFSGKPKAAIVSGIAALLGLAAFSAFLLQLGMPPVPSSIIAKSTLTADTNRFYTVFRTLGSSINSNRGSWVMLFSTLLAGWALIRGISTPRAKAALFLALAGVLHSAFGTYGWYHRYESYIFGAMLYAVLALAPSMLPGLADRWRIAHSAALALVGGLVASPYILGLISIPIAANNIHVQQEQMHRFATGWWKRPLAVNDLGWVSYKNDAYILDLWGLGSHTALEARLSGKDPSWMAEMAKSRNIGLAMVYESWIPAKAAGWIKVGELRLHGARVTPAASEVAIYATSRDLVPEIEALLIDFRKTLPSNASVITRTEALSTAALPSH